MTSSSMCGPSNPLQHLKNHTSFDRSLQQDRFRSSPGALPSSQFRHQQPGAQSLDHEFENFLGAGSSQLQQTPLQTQRSIQTLAAPSPALQQPAWAADFQRLQLNTPPPPAQTLQKPSVGFSGWGAEFLQHMNAPTAAPVTASSPALQQQSGMLGYNSMNTGYMGMGMGMSSYHSDLQAGPSMQQSTEGNMNYTDAEFDQMFEQAATQQFDQKEMMDFPQREAPRPLAEARSQIEELRPDQLEQEAEQEKDKEKDDADELAKTAKQLFQTLSQDKSEKFQNSQFLAFMQKLGDKTVKVEDGKMVEV